MKAIGCVLTVGVALGQSVAWEQHMKRALPCESAGRFQEARAAYELAVKDEVTKPSDSGLRQAAARNSLALIDRHLGLYAEARQEYGQAQGIDRKIARPPEFGVCKLIK